MSAAGDYQKILRLVAAYRKKLELLDEADFQKSPADGSWSYSEVYFHIFDASLLTLATISDCIAGKGEEKTTPMTARLILWLDTLPGRKFKAPAALAKRLQKISKKEAAELMDRFVSEMKLQYGDLGRADKARKTPHPRLGYFNAFQWFRFMEIHLSHHLRQVIRIEKSF